MFIYMKLLNSNNTFMFSLYVVDDAMVKLLTTTEKGITTYAGSAIKINELKSTLISKFKFRLLWILSLHNLSAKSLEMDEINF